MPTEAAPSSGSATVLPPEATGLAPHVRPLARRALAAFVLVFCAARALVIGIMAGRLPDLFLHLGKGNTHVHHLNYGIFLLSGVGAAAVFFQLGPEGRKTVAWLYGAAMALTFDEFGMWLHLGGSYWQRASYDAVVVVAAVLALFAFAPSRERWRGRHLGSAVLTLGTAAFFGALLFYSLHFADRRLGPRLLELEERGPR